MKTKFKYVLSFMKQWGILLFKLLIFFPVFSVKKTDETVHVSGWWIPSILAPIFLVFVIIMDGLTEAIRRDYWYDYKIDKTFKFKDADISMFDTKWSCFCYLVLGEM